MGLHLPYSVGKAVVPAWRTTFALAIDASPDALVSGAWRAKRARLGNAAFLVEGVEFPWGLLLRGLLDGAPAVVGPIAKLMKPGAELRVLLSAVDRDGLGEVNPAVLLARRDGYCDRGLLLTEVGWASALVVAESRSAGAKRLAVGRARPAVIARYRRDGT